MVNINGAMQRLILGFIILIFGLALTPTLYTECQTAVENMTGVTVILIGTMIPIVWAVVMIMIAVGLIASSRQD